MTTKRIHRRYELQGGPVTDGPAASRLLRDLENLLAAPGKLAKGLRPRNGITPIAQFTTAATSGCRVFVVKDSDDPEWTLVGVYRISTGEILNIWEHRDQQGRVRPDTWVTPSPYGDFAMITFHSNFGLNPGQKQQIMVRRGDGYFYAYLLGGMPNITLNLDSSHNFMYRIGPSTLMQAMILSRGAGVYSMHLSFWDIDQVIAGGNQYDAGAVDTGRYTDCYATVQLATNIANDLGKWRFGWTASGEVVVLTNEGRKVYVVDSRTGTITHENTWPSSKVSDSSGATVSNLSISYATSGYYCPVDTLGYISVMMTGASGVGVSAWVRINPKTGAIVNLGGDGVVHHEFTGWTPLPNGRFLSREYSTGRLLSHASGLGAYQPVYNSGAYFWAGPVPMAVTKDNVLIALFEALITDNDIVLVDVGGTTAGSASVVKTLSDIIPLEFRGHVPWLQDDETLIQIKPGADASDPKVRFVTTTTGAARNESIDDRWGGACLGTTATVDPYCYFMRNISAGSLA